MSNLKFINSFRRDADQEKPREKLAKYGPQALRLWELTALILRTGTHSKHHSENVLQMAKRILSEAGFKGLFTQTDVSTVRENFGVYRTHAITIVAIAEICRRLHGKYDSFDASEPSKIFRKFKFLRTAKQEQCFVLHLDEDRKCIYQEMVAIGSRDHVQVYPNDVLRTPIWFGTQAIAIVHNHPGKCVASKEDVAWTLAIAKGASELHHIQVTDHIIIGNDGYFSFLEKGLL